MAQTKGIVISSLEDLIQIFPSLTLPQIISLYRDGLQILARYNDMISCMKSDDNLDDLLTKIRKYIDCTDFLANYLARCFCRANGFDI